MREFGKFCWFVAAVLVTELFFLWLGLHQAAAVVLGFLCGLLADRWLHFILRDDN